MALAGQFDRADCAIFSAALYRDALTETWQCRFVPWIALPADLPEADRGWLTAALWAALDHPAWCALVVIGYLDAFSCLALVLRTGLGVGVASGIRAASGVALTALVSRVLFSEPLTEIMGLGIAFLVAGVLFIELGAAR